MSIASDVRGDIKAAKKLRLPRRAILPGIAVGSFCAWLFDRFGILNLFLPVWNCVAVLGFMLALQRNIWSRAWFWVAMTSIAALHVAVILYIPWGTRWVPALAIAGIDSIDLCATLWLLDAVGRFVDGPGATGGRKERSGRERLPR